MSTYKSILTSIILATFSHQSLGDQVQVPYIFNAGQKAKAAEINANFSILASASNNLSEKLSQIQNTFNISESGFFSTTETDLPPGSIVTIGNIAYTITQFEIPRFDSDDIYLVKFPSSQDFSKGSAGERINVTGAYEGDNIGFATNKKTKIGGFETLIGEGYYYNSSLSVNDTGRKLDTDFYQSLSATILVGPQTRVQIYFSRPKKTLSGTNNIRSADGAQITNVYPPAIKATERELERQHLLSLLQYVSIKKK